MTYEVTAGGRKLTIELVREGQRWHAVIDGRHVECEIAAAGDGTVSILVDGRSYRAILAPATNSASELEVAFGGRNSAVRVSDPRRLPHRGQRFEHEGRVEVRSPMSGRVVRVFVEASQAVEMGQALLVLEAMKMQNEVRSPKKGRVVSFTARQGAAVSTGDLLAEIE